MIRLHPFSARATRNQAHLRIMETTDLHMHVFPYDYYSDRPRDTVGLGRTASIIAQIRAEAVNALLVDNGDFLQGNPMGDYIAYERGMKEGDMHPIITAMNTVGYDAATLGNHEFNYGLEFLSKSLAGANFPIICANIATRLGADPTRDATYLPPYAMLNRAIRLGDGSLRTVRIGLIGFVPPQIMTWDWRHLEGNVTTRDIVETAQAWVPQMREQGCDLIVALSHSGIGPTNNGDLLENASIPLAEVAGIDALVTGHSHLVFPSPGFAGLPAVDAGRGTIHGKPAVMGGFWGSHIGLIDLLLEHDSDGWRVIDFSAEARPISRRNADRTVTALVDDHRPVLDAVANTHSETLAYIRRAVGQTDRPLHSYFALVAEDPSIRIVSDAQKWYVAQLLRGTEHEDLPLLSAAAPFKAGGRGGPDYYTDVPSGAVAIRNVADLYLYPNTVRAVRITGAELRGWLERSAGIFNTIAPGARDAWLLNPDVPSYNFDVIAGVSYQIDVSQPARFGPRGELLSPGACRIVNLTHDGREVRDEMEFIVATNSYRAGGGGDFPGARPETVILEAPDTNRDVIVRYLVEQGTIGPATEGHWSFSRLPGTTVLFETGPAAARYLSEKTTLEIAPAGESAEGFAVYRITL